MKLRLLALTALMAASSSACDPAGDARSDDGGATPSAEATPEPDSTRLLHDLSALAHDSMQGRAVGTPGGAMARVYLIDRLRAAGVEPVGGAYERPFTWGEDGAGVNLVGRVAGAGEGTIVLTAHYDHVGVREGEIFNGADDNASGTAAALEIARLAVQAPLRATLVVALLDAEEVGLRGARAFVADPPIALPPGTLNVNFDMVSRSGGVLWASGASHTPALRPILESIAARAPVTLRLGHDTPNAPEGDDWTGASDHGPFHDAGYPFVYFGVEDHPDYHRPTDDVDRVDPGEFVRSVRTLWMAIAALDEALPLPTGSGGAP